MSICSRVLAVTNQGLIMEYNIYDVLEKVRTRTGMYIGEQKLENLMSFLAGYRFAMESIGAVNISQPDFHGFHDWVAAKYGFYESTSGWARMILHVELGFGPREQCIDLNKIANEIHHRKSMKRFFDLVDEFKG